MFNVDITREDLERFLKENLEAEFPTASASQCVLACFFNEKNSPWYACVASHEVMFFQRGQDYKTYPLPDWAHIFYTLLDQVPMSGRAENRKFTVTGTDGLRVLKSLP